MRTSSFSASSATASAAAAESALTLWIWPSTSGATLETTGIRPASIRSSTDSGRTLATSPTRPRSISSPSMNGGRRLGGEESGVLARAADGERTVLVDQPDQLALDLTDEHHPDHVHRLGRRDPQPAAELRLDPEPVEHARDLRTAPVHHDGLEAGEAEEGDVLGEGALERVVGHRVAAVLHDHDLAVVALEPRQGGGEGAGLGLVGPGGVELPGVEPAGAGVIHAGSLGRAERSEHGLGAHDEYALFSWT